MTVRPPTSDEVLYSEALRSWRERRGMTKKALADRINYDPSRIGHIEAGRQRPTEDFTRQVEAALQADGELWALWQSIAGQRTAGPAPASDRDLRTVEFITWLAEHSDRTFADLYAAVSSAAGRLDAESPSVRHGRGHARRRVTREQVAAALRTYYGDNGFFRARVGEADVRLSMMTDPGWLHVVGLGGECEQFRYVPRTVSPLTVDRLTAAAAVRRLAAVETGSTVMVNNPLYRLVDLETAPGRLEATMTTVDFAEYALTTDMLGDELVDVVAEGAAAMPLRDIHLPDLATARAFGDRMCVGGLNAVVAVARSARPGGAADYVLFVQERSAAVVNLPGALATVPKAFHQPTSEAADEVALSMTLRREFEEELLGREDLEQLSPAARRQINPLHERRTTEPLAWLLDRPGVFRTECTGFGVNMITGNYDFPCLIVIDDESWWQQFGHLIEMNWEAQQVHRYSTLDTAGLNALIADPRWSNEGLFTLLLGLRRLADVGDPERLALPEIEVMV